MTNSEEGEVEIDRRQKRAVTKDRVAQISAYCKRIFGVDSIRCDLVPYLVGISLGKIVGARMILF